MSHFSTDFSKNIFWLIKGTFLIGKKTLVSRLNIKSKIEVVRQFFKANLFNKTFKINFLFDLLKRFPGKQENVAKTKFSCEEQHFVVKLYFVFLILIP